MSGTDKLAEALRAVISKAILEQAATWEEQFDAGPGDVVGVPDAVFVAADAVISALAANPAIAEGMANALRPATGQHSQSFTCPRCGRVSHHPRDVEVGYCGACHDWTGRP